MPMYVYSVDRIKSYTYGPIGPKQDLHLLTENNPIERQLPKATLFCFPSTVIATDRACNGIKWGQNWQNNFYAIELPPWIRSVGVARRGVQVFVEVLDVGVEVDAVDAARVPHLAHSLTFSAPLCYTSSRTFSSLTSHLHFGFCCRALGEK